MRTPILAHIASQKNAVITWQRELTSRPALGPENQGRGEHEKARWLHDELIRIGASSIVQYPAADPRVPEKNRPNISARIRGKQDQTLWLIAHMDVVPEGNLALWKSDPFTLRVDGDYVYGRGVEDNQQAIVTALLVAEALTATNITPERSLGLLFVSDEETGMTYGLPHVLRTAPELIKPTDLVLVPDMGNSTGTMVEIAEKSCLWLKFTVSGRQCHASTPEQGINSLVAASACVLALEELYRRFREKDPLYSPSWSTFVPSKKEANVDNINTLPGRDVFYLDCRVLPKYALDDVLQASKEIAATVAQDYSATIDIEIVHDAVAPPQTPADSEVVQRLLHSLRTVRGVEGVLSGAGGQTVASCLRHKGIPTAVWSTLVPNPHTPNERSSISQTIADAQVVADMLF